jgi:hypothetical protein
MSKIASRKDLVSYLAMLHGYLNNIEYIISSKPIIILSHPMSKIASIKDLVSYLAILHGYLNSIEYIISSEPIIILSHPMSKIHKRFSFLPCDTSWVPQ